MKKWIFSLVLAGFMVGPVMAGVVFEVEVTDHQAAEPKQEEIEVWAEAKNLKMEVPSSGDRSQNTMIYRGGKREMTVVDHDNQSYMLIDDKAVRGMAGEIDTAMSQVEEALKNVPADKRAMVEKLLKERMPQMQPKDSVGPTSELRKTRETGEKAGYPCVKYEVLLDGKKTKDLWVTDWDNVEGGEEVADAFLDMAEFFKELLANVPQARGSGRIGEDIFVHMKELGGFPVVTREFGDDGTLEEESILRSATRMTLDPDAFEPPSGYKRQEMFSSR